MKLLSQVPRSIATVLCCLLVFVFVARSPLAAAEPIKVGVVLSISGWAGFMGSAARDAMVVAVEDCNKKGGVQGREVRLYVEDDKSNPTNAVIGATKLVRDIKVAVMTGPTLTDCAMAMIPVAEQEQIPFVVLGPAVSPFKKWVFHTTPSELVNAAATLEYAARSLGAKRIAVLHDTANFGMIGWKVFSGEINKYPGSSIVIEEKFEPSDTNMIPQLTNIKAANADVLLVQVPGGASAAVIAKNYKQLNIKTPVLGCPGMGTLEFLKIGGRDAEDGKWLVLAGKLMVAESLPSGDRYRQELYEPFKKIMREKYGESKILTIFHASAHDAVRVVLAALKAAGSDDRAALRDALEKVRYEGHLGSYACTPNNHRGMEVFDGTVSEVKNGEFVPSTRFVFPVAK